ncbi:MAG: hypothetical protein DWQ10_01215, partial [Calditrichaeota bacterium]
MENLSGFNYFIQKKLFPFYVFLIVLLTGFTSVQAQYLDLIIFGNDSSEAAHNVEFANSSTAVGAFGESYRKLDGTDSESSWMELTVKVEPGVQNYMTFKFWGSDTLENRQYLYMSYWQIIFGSLGRWVQIGSFGSDEPEIMNWDKNMAYPNRFVYVTCMIPDEIVRSDSLQLKLANSKLPIYQAYVHTNSYFEPGEDEQQGTALGHSGPIPSPDGQSQIEHIHTQLDLAVDRFLTWQYWGEE